jgi:hypothetical protein
MSGVTLSDGPAGRPWPADADWWRSDTDDFPRAPRPAEPPADQPSAAEPPGTTSPAAEPPGATSPVDQTPGATSPGPASPADASAADGSPAAEPAAATSPAGEPPAAASTDEPPAAPSPAARPVDDQPDEQPGDQLRDQPGDRPGDRLGQTRTNKPTESSPTEEPASAPRAVRPAGPGSGRPAPAIEQLGADATALLDRVTRDTAEIPRISPRPFTDAPKVGSRPPEPPPVVHRPGIFAPPASLRPVPVPPPLGPPPLGPPPIARPSSDPTQTSNTGRRDLNRPDLDRPDTVRPDAGRSGTVHVGPPSQRQPRPSQPPGAFRPTRPPRRNRRPARPRRPWLAIPALVVLALAGAFFAWVSAEPFWLAVGHGSAGTATVVVAGEDCRATFVADGNAFSASTVDLSGMDTVGCVVGVQVPARMVSAASTRAYAADPAGLNLRWMLGFGLVLLCGALIAWVTGAGRFRGWQRAASVGLCVAGPVAIAAALVAAAY